MPHDQGLRILLVKPLQQQAQGLALGGGAGIRGLSVGSESTYVAYAHAVAVVVAAVRSHPFQWPSSLYCAVGGDDVVITTTLPPQ